MFSWLISSFFMQNVSDKEQHMPIRILRSKQLDNLYSTSHAFLTCPATIAHIRQTKVMFLMRGLPGSGKSTIVRQLTNIYAPSVAVCSADNYFINSEGVYVFNLQKIGEAHRICQMQTEEACKDNVMTVIIDNTNIRLDECRPYFQKAFTYGYIVIIVEPRTDWKRDANELYNRNTHDVPLDKIQQRLSQYKPLIPFYFGLFLNDEQTNYVLQQAFDYYQEALQTFPQLKSDLKVICKNKNTSLNNLLSRSNMSVQSKLLHCTMKFIGKMTDQTQKEYTTYAANRIVSHALGKMFRAYVVGFVITPDTLGARLLFPDRYTWALWDQDDNEVQKSESTPKVRASGMKKPHSNRRQNRSRATTNDDTNTNEDFDANLIRSVAEEDTLLIDSPLKSNETQNVSFLQPTYGFLSRAHLTCGVAPNVSAAQTGFDMINMIKKESDVLQKNINVPDYNNARSVMKFFGDGCCIVYLKEPIAIETVFTGYFH